MKRIIAIILALLSFAACAHKEAQTVFPPVQPVVQYGFEGGELSVDVEVPVTFSAKLLSKGPVTCEWYIDDVKIAQTPTFVYAFPHVGKYKVLFKAYNEAGSEEKTYIVTVVGVPLEINFTPSDTEITCVMKDEIVFKAEVTAGGKGVRHSWKLGEDEVSSEAEYRFKVPAAEVYTVSYTGTNEDEFTVTRSWTVTADELPLEVELSNPGREIIVVEGAAVSLSATVLNGGRGVTHSWLLDGTQASGTAEFQKTFDAVGEHQLTYKAVNAKGESFTHDWTIKVQAASSEIAYMYMDFEDGILPSIITGNNLGGKPVYSVIDNPYKTATNSSSKVLVDDMHTSTGGTSGYLDFKNISASGKDKATVLRVKVYLGEAVYYPYLQIIRDSQPRKRPRRINGQTLSDPQTQEAFNSAVRRNDWNVFEYDIADFGYENFAEITQFQLRPFSKWDGNGCDATVSTTNPKIVWYDDIEFVE